MAAAEALRCPSGSIHASFPIAASAGLLGSPAHATLAGTPEGGFMLEVAISPYNLSSVWPYVRQGILDALPLELVPGADR